jgi:hypothetical protein
MEALGRCEMAFPKILYVILPFSVRNISFLLGPRASPPAPATLPLSNVSRIYPPMRAGRPRSQLTPHSKVNELRFGSDLVRCTDLGWRDAI